MLQFTIIKVINKIQKAKKALSSRHGKFPSESEIAKFTGLSTNRIVLASKCLRVVGSIDQKLGYFMSAKFVVWLEILVSASMVSFDLYFNFAHLLTFDFFSEG